MAIHTARATLLAEDMEAAGPSRKAIVDAEALKADAEVLNMDAATAHTTSISLPSRATPSSIPQRDIRKQILQSMEPATTRTEEAAVVTKGNLRTSIPTTTSVSKPTTFKATRCNSQLQLSCRRPRIRQTLLSLPSLLVCNSLITFLHNSLCTPASKCHRAIKISNGPRKNS